MAKSNVGKSSRTPVKHYILNGELGRQVGVLGLNKGKVPAKLPILIVDLCAGDGNEDSGNSSPGIMFKHANYKGIGGQAKIILYEKNSYVYEQLKANCQGKFHNIELRNKDSMDFTLDDENLESNQAVFIHIDPNNVNQLPLTQALVDSFTPTTSMLITMGCNVGGLKRLGLEDRKVWFDKFLMVAERKYSNHDLQIFILEKDVAQWAYLLIIPSKWAEETLKEYTGKKIKEIWPQGVKGVSLKIDGVAAVENIINELFLTKAERAENV
jgi:hypothetical protein